MNINWYPGHMAKAKRELTSRLSLIDLVIEIRDARAPMSTANPEIDHLFAKKGRLLILTKSDLADESVTQKWLSYFAAKGMHVISYSAATGDPQKAKRAIDAAAQPIVQKFAAKGVNKTIRALVCGVPNVGKSAFLNRLCASRGLKEENRPGVTRSVQWVRISPTLELMDSPGLLWPKIANEQAGITLALLGSIPEEAVAPDEMAFELLKRLTQTHLELLISRYKLEELPDDLWDIFSAICAKRGFLLRGGEIDEDRGVKMLLEEFRNGKIGKISLDMPGRIDGTT